MKILNTDAAADAAAAAATPPHRTALQALAPLDLLFRHYGTQTRAAVRKSPFLNHVIG